MTFTRMYAVLYNKIQKTISADPGKMYYVGAVCFDKSYNIVSVGFNSYIKTHPMQKTYAEKAGKSARCYLHAEIAALVHLRQKAYGLLVLRVLANGMVKIAKPCSICDLAIKEAGLEEVWYSDRMGSLCRFVS